MNTSRGGAVERSDILIVGGGPAGLTAAIYAGRAGFDTRVLEAASPGGWAALTDRIENYPGTGAVQGDELAARMVEQARSFGAVIVPVEVTAVAPLADGFTVSGGGASFGSRAVILAVGTAYRKLGVPGEEELTGRGVSYCATCDGPLFKGAEIAVVGGGDSALQEALYLTRFARRVHLIHRRDDFRAARALADRVRAHPGISCLCGHEVERVNGSDAVESLSIRAVESGEATVLPVSGVFFFVGLTPKTGFLGDVVEKDESGFIVTDDRMRTSRRGLLAAGDCRAKVLRQVSTAVGDGATAAFVAQRYVEAGEW
jgi:thioredoxin reductase (NADPH)